MEDLKTRFLSIIQETGRAIDDSADGTLDNLCTFFMVEGMHLGLINPEYTKAILDELYKDNENAKASSIRSMEALILACPINPENLWENLLKSFRGR